MTLVPGKYIADDGTFRIVRVESDRFGDATFKWTDPGPGIVFNGFKHMRPRRIFGVSVAGKSRSAIVPDVTADVWTGVATTFNVEDSEGVETAYTITARNGEMVHLTT